MSDYEDILLREEFRLIQELQKDKEFSRYVTVKYKERFGGEVKSVLSSPTGNKFPETYIAVYQMPVYVSAGQLKNDFRGTATIVLSESVLRNKSADNAPHIDWQANCIPFNNHVTDRVICNGYGSTSAWGAAKDLGIWYLIIVMGLLINQDPSVTPDEDCHMNSGAYNYWVRRGRQPVTPIKWPRNLLEDDYEEEPIMTIKKKNTTTQPGISIKKKSQEQPAITIKKR